MRRDGLYSHLSYNKALNVVAKSFGYQGFTYLREAARNGSLHIDDDLLNFKIKGKVIVNQAGTIIARTEANHE